MSGEVDLTIQKSAILQIDMTVLTYRVDERTIIATFTVNGKRQVDFPFTGSYHKSMKPYGYINLKEAERISGKTLEALKKQCQEGRIRGAIKDAGSWYVPRDEILVKPAEPSDDALTLMAIGAEAAGMGVNVTVYLKGLVIEGRLISTKRYIEYMREHTKITYGNDKEIEEMINKTMSHYYDQILDRTKDSRIDFLHIEHATVLAGSGSYEPKGALLRLKIDEIDGFQLGTTKVFPPAEDSEVNGTAA